MTFEQDLSKIGIKARAKFLRAYFSRLTTLLQIHCDGYLLILSEQVDEAYIKLRHFVEYLLHTDGFEILLDAYPGEAIPASLHSLGEDADVAWDTIQQAVNEFRGALLEFCVGVGAQYDEEAKIFEKEILEPYDKFIESFRRDKREREKEFLERADSHAKRFREQVGVDASASEVYVNLERINELRAIKPGEYDVSRLIRLCEELNTSYSNQCYMATAMIVRAILDHIPPIFECKNFSEVANNYSGGSKSFKQSMAHLENSSRKIADAYLHTQVRRKEALPNKTQVNFSADLDVLLAETVRILK